jgi:hypothetical protein
MIKILQYLILLSFITLGLLKAEVGYNGSAELDLFYRSNQDLDDKSQKFNGAFLQEIAIILNVFGNHAVESDFFKAWKWKLAQKVATDYKFDSFGKREAWIGTNTAIGEFRYGNQFSNYYLLQDWPYGTAGAGNTWAEYGVHSIWYAQGISYFSPVIEGFNINFQYNNGGYRPYKKTTTMKPITEWKQIETTGGETIFVNTLVDIKEIPVVQQKSYSYASEITAGYTLGIIRLDVAAYLAQNASSNDFLPDTFEGFNDAKNRVQSYYASTILNLDPFELKLGYSYNKHIIDSVNYTNLHKILLQGKYTINDKNNVILGYQFMPNTLAKIDGETIYAKNALHMVNFQYNHTLDGGVSLFLQVRQSITPFKTPNKIQAGYMIDGKHPEAHSSTRVLVGAWMGF